MQADLVVFDMAGTTVYDRNFVHEAFTTAMKTAGYEVNFAEVNPLMGYKKTTAIKLLLQKHEPESARITDDLINRIHTVFENNMVIFYQNSDEIRPLPYAEEIFRFLKQQHVWVALNTGFSRKVAQTILDRLGWKQAGLIDFWVASDEVEKGRPYPFMIQKIKNLAKLSDSSRVAKVGDTEVDINEGKNAGCEWVIGITGAYTRAELTLHEPTHLINHLQELEAILQ